jgi:outer membrane protein OmpA-like peptidoglycan-associated protein
MMTKKYALLILKTFILCASCFSQNSKDTTLNFFFATNSATLDSSQHKAIKSLASVVHIKFIKGYADTTGSRKYNLSLSQKRALAVYVAFKGDADSSLNVNLSYAGESNDEPELWRNRRVQVIASLMEENDNENRTEAATVHSVSANKPVNDTITRIPVVVRDFNLEYVYFMPDQAVVTPESFSYLKQVAANLKTYKTETFEIIGHVNYQSRLDSSHLTGLYQLSERRAKTIYDYLEQQGIAANRMTYRGVGNSDPIYPSPRNDDEKRKNMRVQIIVRK